MFTPIRALQQNIDAGEPMPHVGALKPLYEIGCQPRRGEVLMIAGKPGTQKSGFALWLVNSWNLPTLYCSGDMSPYQASARVTSMRSGVAVEDLDIDTAEQAVSESRIAFSFDSPITFRGMAEELEAFVELHGEWPAVIVIDNLMDIQGCEADYVAQMAAFQELSALSRATGATILVLHHVSDKSDSHSVAAPPPRRDIKGGMGEKPEICLTVGLDKRSNEYRVAVVKNRMGPDDPNAGLYALLQAYPETTTFGHYVPATEWNTDNER